MNKFSEKSRNFFKKKLSSLIPPPRPANKKRRRTSEEPKHLLWTFLLHWSLKFHADFYKKYKTFHIQTPGKQQC